MTNAREFSLNILKQTYGGGFPDILLNKAEDIYISDLNLSRKLVYGVLENYRFLDLIISRLSKIPLKKIHPEIKIILSMSLYQLIFLDKIPKSAAVNEGVKLSKKIKGGAYSPYVNGVLRNFLRHIGKISSLSEFKGIEYLGYKYSLPEWLIKMWERDYGLDFLEDLRLPFPPAVRVNLSKIDMDNFLIKMKDRGIEAERSNFAKSAVFLKSKGILTEIPEYKMGLFSFQNSSSQHFIERLPRVERVLDLCASPGGKTFGYSERYGESQILSLDIYREKIKNMISNKKRLGLKNIEFGLNDATKYNPEYEDKFDLVICDVPCSDLGSISNKPEIVMRRTIKDIEDLSRLQFVILKNASKYVKRGGTLAYSTCTVSKKENSLNKERFLNSGGEYKLIEENQILPDNKGNHGFYYAIMERDYE